MLFIESGAWRQQLEFDPTRLTQFSFCVCVRSFYTLMFAAAIKKV